MDTSAVLVAFGMTMIAGLSTGLGALLSLPLKRDNTRFLCVALGFSAGVMIYVSFVELLPQGREALTRQWGEPVGAWGALLAFFGGMGLIALIDKLIPDECNPHELGQTARSRPDKPSNADRAAGSITPAAASPASRIAQSGVNPADREIQAGVNPARLGRTGLFTALALGIHNFPEGMATFMAALNDPGLGAAITAAIAIHNIPEGIAVAVPVYYASGSRSKAFGYSFLSGLAEPAGAAIGFLLLLPFLGPAVFGILFAAVSGIMVFISLDELLPAAREYGEHHLCIYGLVGGMGVMAASLLLLG